MGISRRCDGSFYVRCDWDDCGNKVNLKAKDFYEASAEARRLGWTLAKDRDGHWVNFCTKFCQLCHFAPQVVVYRKRRTCDTSDNSAS